MNDRAVTADQAAADLGMSVERFYNHLIRRITKLKITIPIICALNGVAAGNWKFSKFNQNGLWIKDLFTDNESILIEDFDLINWLNWDIRGDYLYYFKPESGVWKYHLESNQENILLPLEADILHQYSISADQNYLYYVKKEPDQGDIFRVQLSH